MSIKEAMKSWMDGELPIRPLQRQRQGGCPCGSPWHKCVMTYLISFLVGSVAFFGWFCIK